MDYFPWDDIPDSNVVPTGIYQLRGEKLEVVTTSNNKKMYSMQVSVELPEDFAGQIFFENFVIGSDDDSMAEDVATWKKSFGARRLKSALKAAQMPANAAEAQICATFAGVVLLAAITEYVEPALNRDGNPNAYAGTPRNKFNAFYKVGERPIGSGKSTTMQKVTTGAAPATGPAALTPPATGQPEVSPAAPPVAPAPPTAVPTPAAPPAPATPNVVTPMPDLPAEKTLPCGICGEQVPISQLQDHMNACVEKAQKAAAGK